MPYIDHEIILEAKKMDLLTYLENYDPHELVHVSGDVYCTKTHDSLRISNGKWCWYSRDIGGRSALDYLIKVKGYSFLDAVEHIMGRAATAPPVSLPVQKEKESGLRSLPHIRTPIQPIKRCDAYWELRLSLSAACSRRFSICSA